MLLDDENSNMGKKRKLTKKGTILDSDWIAEAMVAYVVKGAKVVFDPGVGKGAFYTALKKINRNKKFFGVDIDPEIIKDAQLEGVFDANAALEKWYVAVQTLYLPDWQSRLNYLRDWYKYRKVLVVNPVNGKTVVADVADSGPAQFTGKHYGGSPEVMAYLGLNVHMQKGPVILFFVDDPNNEIPLGPVEYNVTTGTPQVAKVL